MNNKDRHELEHHTRDDRHDSLAYTDDRDVAESFDEQTEVAGPDGGRSFAVDAESVQRMRDAELGESDPTDVADPVEMMDLESVGEVRIGDAEQPLGPATVDEIGEAAGLSYQDNQPLGSAARLEARDQERWELDPASAEDWPHR